MADGVVQVAPDSTGKKVDASELVVGSNTVERQRVVIGDDAAAGGLAAVKATAPTGTEQALVVRPIPSGTQTMQGVQDTATVGSITSATSVVGPLSVVQRNVVTISIMGTYAGVTFIIEASDDGGTSWFPLQVIDNATGQAGSSWTPGTNAAASYDAAIGGYTHCRVRATAWTSGTATVRLTAQSFAYDPVVAALSQGLAANASAARGFPVLMAGWNGTNVYTFKTDTNGVQLVRPSDGTNSAVFKAASTAAAAADVALVVSISPNSPTPATAVAAQACSAKVLNAIGAATNVKASAGNVFGLSLINNNAAAVYVEFFDASSVTLGTTTPVAVFLIPASGTLTIPPASLACFACATQIFIAAVTAYNGTTAGSVTGTVFYK